MSDIVQHVSALSCALQYSKARRKEIETYQHFSEMLLSFGAAEVSAELRRQGVDGATACETAIKNAENIISKLFSQVDRLNRTLITGPPRRRRSCVPPGSSIAHGSKNTVKRRRKVARIDTLESLSQQEIENFQFADEAGFLSDSEDNTPADNFAWLGGEEARRSPAALADLASLTPPKGGASDVLNKYIERLDAEFDTYRLKETPITLQERGAVQTPVLRRKSIADAPSTAANTAAFSRSRNAKQIDIDFSAWEKALYYRPHQAPSCSRLSVIFAGATRNAEAAWHFADLNNSLLETVAARMCFVDKMLMSRIASDNSNSARRSKSETQLVRKLSAALMDAAELTGLSSAAEKEQLLQSLSLVLSNEGCAATPATCREAMLQLSPQFECPLSKTPQRGRTNALKQPLQRVLDEIHAKMAELQSLAILFDAIAPPANYQRWQAVRIFKSLLALAQFDAVQLEQSNNTILIKSSSN